MTSYNILADCYASKRLYSSVPDDILTWSVRGPAIVARIGQINPDIACLQEVQAAHWDALSEAFKLRGWAGMFAQKARSRGDGCALLYRTRDVSLVASETIYFNDGNEPSGHLALVGHFSTPLGATRIASTHLRWQADTSEPKLHIGYRQAAELLVRLSTEKFVPTIVCGDFNFSAMHPALRIFTDNGFVDAFASASPHFTCAPNGRASRIDYVLVSETLKVTAESLPHISDGAILPNVDHPSDHLPITALVQIAPPSSASIASSS